ncbi:MAG: 2-C-methyl-D-erythritol 4-phosphate cytidylyltransferase [Gammaproteobacteria bacterium HGW-Gammaproteobacteria-1]|jgi:2-C-methyl-D-erythritol 4-phosphate cytidylyltransferase|nr:MAG: 2-C-methyl-D-erythritol 4-phosphate cytidylyltransferase [Gammaproteobacteria bacterium HGW-Gammaproteobacteria-1]
MKHWVVIPAAGVGARMKADRPKQYLPLRGRTVIEHTLSCFTHHPAIAGIVVALSPDDPYWPGLRIDSPVPLHVAAGGQERCHSVLNALRLLAQHADANDWVLVHDAARPCLTCADIDKLCAELCDDEVGGILAVPVRDTMKRADGEGRISATEDRNGLWHALTPQMFRLGLLTQALEQALADGFVVTDEASAVEHAGLRPKLVEGRADNIKVTRPEDLALAEFFLSR